MTSPNVKPVVRSNQWMSSETRFLLIGSVERFLFLHRGQSEQALWFASGRGWITTNELLQNGLGQRVTVTSTNCDLQTNEVKFNQTK